MWKKPVFTVAVVGATLMMAGPTSAGAPNCPPSKWTKVIGKTTAVVGWESDDGGLHLRVTTPYRKGKPYRVTGTVCALDKKKANKITQLVPFKLEKGDHAKVGPKGHCVWFGFWTGGHVDGFDFKTPARGLLFGIKIDGKKVPVRRIHIGSKDNHPKDNPALFLRAPQHAKSAKKTKKKKWKKKKSSVKCPKW